MPIISVRSGISPTVSVRFALCLSLSNFLIDYPFANRLFPGSLDVIEKFQKHGTVVILTDGDAVFQPRKIERSGICEAVDNKF